jgi:hypothetical protein
VLTVYTVVQLRLPRGEDDRLREDFHVLKGDNNLGSESRQM